MALDPQAKAFLDQAAAAGGPPIHELPVAQFRQLMRDLMGTPNPEPVARIIDRTIPGPGGPIPIRVYGPKGPEPTPVLMYMHGGGWVGGDLESHDALCRSLSNASGCTVAAIDYRLAPEHKFPAAPDDCYAALQWIAANGAEIGVDPSKLAVGGDSAGGNLTAVVAQMARDRRGPNILLQVMLYPVTDHNFATMSYQQNAEGYLLTREAMVWFWNHYLRNATDGGSPVASPLRGDLANLPPAFVVTAEFDPLRDEGEAYAKKLEQAGGQVTLKRYDGMIHGFFGLATVLDQGRQGIADAAAALRATFGMPRASSQLSGV